MRSQSIYSIVDNSSSKISLIKLKTSLLTNKLRKKLQI